MRRRTVASTIGLAAFVCACANTSPQKTTPLYAAEIDDMRRESPVILVDACILRNEIGSSYVLRQASLDAATHSATSLQSLLADGGISAGPILIPYLCGTPWFEPEKVPNLIAQNSGSPTEEIGQFPVRLVENKSADATLDGARLRLLAEVAKPGNQSELKRALDLPPGDVGSLRQAFGSKKVWVIAVGGTQVSMAKTASIGMLTGVTTLLSFGVGYVYMPVDGFVHHVALVDLEKNHVVYTNTRSLNDDPTEKEAFDTSWMRNAIRPLLVGLADMSNMARPAPAKVVSSEDRLSQSAASTPTVLQGPNPVAAAPLLPLRARPMSDSLPIAYVSVDTPLTIESKIKNSEGEWAYVETAGTRGWILSGALRN